MRAQDGPAPSYPTIGPLEETGAAYLQYRGVSVSIHPHSLACHALLEAEMVVMAKRMIVGHVGSIGRSVTVNDRIYSHIVVNFNMYEIQGHSATTTSFA